MSWTPIQQRRYMLRNDNRERKTMAVTQKYPPPPPPAPPIHTIPVIPNSPKQLRFVHCTANNDFSDPKVSVSLIVVSVGIISTKKPKPPICMMPIVKKKKKKKTMKIYSCHTRETVMKIRLRSSNIIRWKTVYIYYLNTTESCITWCKLCARTTAELFWCENQN